MTDGHKGYREGKEAHGMTQNKMVKPEDIKRRRKR
jgi:hypothetical protein